LKFKRFIGIDLPLKKSTNVGWIARFVVSLLISVYSLGTNTAYRGGLIGRHPVSLRTGVFIRAPYCVAVIVKNGVATSNPAYL